LPRIDAALTNDILAFLGILGGRKPDVELLDDLGTTYTRYVPWAMNRALLRLTLAVLGLFRLVLWQPNMCV
jgi:hypothetical protein